MNFPTPPLKSILTEALEHIKDQSAEDDAQEEILISEAKELYSDHIDDDDPDDAVPQVFSLKSIPIEKWDSIVLSEASQFGHSSWDFSSYPHVNKWQVIINFDYDNKVGVNLVDPAYKHWARICKMLVFYCIPHFAASNYARSYGSINSSKAKTLQLLQLFKDEHLYIGEIYSKEYRTINDLSRETIDKFILSRPTAGARWAMARVMRFWQKLSAGELVPMEYAVTSKSCRYTQVSSAHLDTGGNRLHSMSYGRPL